MHLFLPGVCLSPEKCGSRSGGKSKGQCAQGFGVCCVFIIMSDDNINLLDQKVVYLRNLAFPQASTTNLVQTITLKPKDEDTSQLLVEFLEFQVYCITKLESNEAFSQFQLDPGSMDPSSPSLGGCDRHSLSVSSVDGPDVNVGELCGFNNGQHLYIHLRRTVTPVTFTFNFTDSLPYIYNNRITQVFRICII